MTHNFNSNTHNKEEWLTPPNIIEALGKFDLDPCAPHPSVRPWDIAKIHYHKEMDGLSQQWDGRVWLNPPYGTKTFEWIKKLSEHGNGIALIFARTETKGFHTEIWDKADAIFFFKGRLCFHEITGKKGGTANAPSCLVAFGKENVKAIENSALQGKLVILRGDA